MTMLTFDRIVTLFVAGMLLAFASAYARGEPDDRGQRAELPDQMMGGWCFDKLKTRALAAEGEYYPLAPLTQTTTTVPIAGALPFQKMA
jgi:hypothetical protein